MTTAADQQLLDDGPAEYVPQTHAYSALGGLPEMLARRTIEKAWGFEGWQVGRALDSAVFFELLRQMHKVRILTAEQQAGCVINLDDLWAAAGEPEEWEPTHFRDDLGDLSETPEIRFEVDADGVMMGTHEAAGWYAQSLCDEVQPGDVCEMFY